MNLIITQPQSCDVSQIISLYTKTWLDTYPNTKHGISFDDIKDKTDKMSQPDKVKKFRENLSNRSNNLKSFFRVAKVGDKILGVCGAVEEDGFIHLASLYVLPDEQKRGVGAALMNEFLNWARNRPIKLHVVTYNQKAITFYEKWGFKDTGKRFTEDRYKMKSGNYLPEMEMQR
jgi:GNAT superfamily N-acetyltransferase